MISLKKTILMCVLSASLAAAGAYVVSVNLQDARLKELDEISSLVAEQYYMELNREDLFDGAAKGMMRSFADDYAAYYTQEDFQRVMERNSGEFVGVGMTIQKKDGYITIASVNEGTAADRAGLMPNDIILRINGTQVAHFTLEEASALMGKSIGEPVQIVVNRNGTDQVFDMITEQIVKKRVHYQLLDEKIAYIKIDEFSGDCVLGTQLALDKAKAEAKGIVLDLRDNPGGGLEDVIAIADMLIPQGVIMTVRSRVGDEEVYNSDAQYLDMPLAVLVNGNSASASEVLAGAIRDHKRGKIVGEKTFGKGIVQTTFGLRKSPAYVKLTTAIYCTPSGENIHGKGIKPDVHVILTKPAPVAFKDDNQLIAAIKTLK